MRQLVRLRTRPSRDGRTFKYFLDYKDENNKRRQISLGHADKRKALRQRDQKERELRMGVTPTESMPLSAFMKDSLERTHGQVRESTLYQARIAMEHFIRTIGDIDYDRVKHTHGERFVQACLDGGNSPATVGKKLRHLNRFFQLAIYRGQLEENPVRQVRRPRVPRQEIHIFNDDECLRLVRAAEDHFATQSGKNRTQPITWPLLIRTGLCTGMRRGELLNTTWHDIDFEKKVISVAPKADTKSTWEWHIKDTDRRTLPLIDGLVDLFAKHQAEQPEGCTYVFVPVARYDYIQKLRKRGEWSVERGKNPINNFDRQFRTIRKRAGICDRTFHDLRRTCLTNWSVDGLREFDLTQMAGHASFETTRRFYLAVKEDLVNKARQASSKAMDRIFVAHLLRAPSDGHEQERPPTVNG